MNTCIYNEVLKIEVIVDESKSDEIKKGGYDFEICNLFKIYI